MVPQKMITNTQSQSLIKIKWHCSNKSKRFFEKMQQFTLIKSAVIFASIQKKPTKIILWEKFSFFEVPEVSK